MPVYNSAELTAHHNHKTSPYVSSTLNIRIITAHIYPSARFHRMLLLGKQVHDSLYPTETNSKQAQLNSPS